MSADPFADAAEVATVEADLRKVQAAAWEEGYRALVRGLVWAGREVNPGYDCPVVLNPYRA